MENPSVTHAMTPDIFIHIRVIVGIVLGLTLSRLLTGAARFVQHPALQLIYPVHLGWVCFMLLAVVDFWWFEFRLNLIKDWDFETYFYILFYASLYFLACTLLFPDNMDEYTGYRDYFMSRRKWFFAILALIFLVDVGDTLLKGLDYYNSYGVEYPIRTVLFVAGCLFAMFTRNQRYHVLFVTVVLIYEVVFIWQQTLD
jgi:hypothetical protein